MRHKKEGYLVETHKDPNTKQMRPYMMQYRKGKIVSQRLITPEMQTKLTDKTLKGYLEDELNASVDYKMMGYPEIAHDEAEHHAFWQDYKHNLPAAKSETKIVKNGWRITTRKDPKTGEPRPIKIWYKDGQEKEWHWLDLEASEKAETLKENVKIAKKDMIEEFEASIDESYADPEAIEDFGSWENYIVASYENAPRVFIIRTQLYKGKPVAFASEYIPNVYVEKQERTNPNIFISKQIVGDSLKEIKLLAKQERERAEEWIDMHAK